MTYKVTEAQAASQYPHAYLRQLSAVSLLKQNSSNETIVNHRTS